MALIAGCPPSDVNVHIRVPLEAGPWPDDAGAAPDSGGLDCVPGLEVCDGVDNDCEPSTPDGLHDPAVGEPCDGPDTDRCEEGVATCIDGALICGDDTGDILDLCDGLDNDCNPSSVDGAGEPTLGAACDGADADACLEGSTICRGGALICNDGSDSVSDICDGLDNDCDASTPDGAGDGRVGVACDGADTDLCADGLTVCAGASVICDDRAGDALDLCDGLDNDCDPTTADGAHEVCPDVDGGAGVCRGGACAYACSAMRGDCNVRALDGCESDLLIDSDNCGRCGDACEDGHACEAGVCIRRNALLRSFGLGEVADVATDAAGHVYVVGKFAGSVDFGGGVTRTATDGYDAYVASYDRLGTLRWVRVLSGTNHQIGYAIATDASGSLYVVGTFYGTVDLGAGSHSSAGGLDAFIASYTTASGEHRWSRVEGSAGGETFVDVAVNSAESVTAVGDFTGSVSFGGAAIESHGSVDGVVAAYSTASGVHFQSTAYGGTAGDYMRHAAADGSGGVCITGFFSGSIALGPYTHASRGYSDVIVFCLSGSGAYSWSQAFGGSQGDWPAGIAVDASGSVYVTGHFQGTTRVGTTTLTSVPSGRSMDVMVAAFSRTGTPRWARSYGSSSSDYAYGVTIDPTGHVLLTGAAGGSFDYGAGATTHFGSRDIFVLSLTSAGAFRWSREWGGSRSDRASSIAVSRSGDVYVAGLYIAPADFGAGAVYSTTTRSQGFLARTTVD